MFYDNDGSETLLYDNTGVEYGTGVFTITINPPVITNAIIIRRTGILTLCELEIYGSKGEYTRNIFNKHSERKTSAENINQIKDEQCLEKDLGRKSMFPA